jgi:hypothetical protein
MRPLILSLVLILSGCATITRGTTEVLTIETDPPGADVQIQPKNHDCKSPCAVSLKRKGVYSIYISKPGYEPVSMQVLPQIAGAGAAGMAGNVLVGGLIGALVDSSSGAMKELKPNPVRVNLIRANATAAAAP